MGERVVKLPDIGEGVAEAELVEWRVKVGDIVREDTVLAAVMTDKATVEIPAPADGTVSWLGAEVGEVVAVGAPLLRIAVPGEEEGDAPAPARETGEPARHDAEPLAEGLVEEGEGQIPDAGPAAREEGQPPEPQPARTRAPEPKATAAPARRRPAGLEGDRPLASPAVRLRAREAGLDLRHVPGSGPAGRITHDDLDRFIESGRRGPSAGRVRRTGMEEIKVTGLRRRIAERMAQSSATIPHITYVEEVDVSALEALRARLNRDGSGRPRLTILPFLVLAMVRAIEDQPQLNAHYDGEAGVLTRHAAIHVGIATQTPAGLAVPVLRHAEARDLWECAAEIARVAEAARAGTATREELSGSTVTITSLGALGGIVSTPIINRPEVAIVGVNKIATRPHWDGQGFVPRQVMNLSSSFDHRVIDGWDAATFVQRIRTLMENPAMIFIGGGER